MSVALVVAPAPFKGACSAVVAAAAIAAGVRLVLADADVREVPVADGGEGTLDAILAAAGGARRRVRVAGPLGDPLAADLGLLPGGLAVVELAQASGYERLPAAARDPERTTTLGTGELIRAALDHGARRILLTVGGSATNDGGMGLARALGVRFLDAAGRELAGTGADLARLARIDRSRLDARLAAVPVEIACDVVNPLTGPHGAARVFGPQKGAGPEAVARLDAGLERLARCLVDAGCPDPSALPGAGAAGGAAGGAVALLGATIRPGAELVLETVGLAGALTGASLCITGEGRLDAQTLRGKAPAAVAAAARAAGVPCVGLCGELDLLPGLVRRAGMAAAFPINRQPGGDTAALMAGVETELMAAGAAVAGLWAAARAQPGPR